MSAYKISTTSGHLTAANKRDLSHMLDNGMSDGKTRAGISYQITAGEAADAYQVRTARMETDDWGRKAERAHRATFTAKAVSA